MAFAKFQVLLAKLLLICYLNKLPISNLRAQTYDGAANMSGMHNGCQASVKKLSPRVKYYHCGAHVTQLAILKAITAGIFMKDPIQQVQELVNYTYNASDNFKT